jgi:Mn-dependent DtxR family transcriptional regulator
MSRTSINELQNSESYTTPPAIFNQKTINIDPNKTLINKPLEKGPRSRIVEAILLTLYLRPMRSYEIASIIGKNSKLVSSYLSYWKSRGYVEYRSGYWILTKIGEEYVKTFIEALGIPILAPTDVVQLAQKLINEPDFNAINNWIQQYSPQKETKIQQFIEHKIDSKVGKQDNINKQKNDLMKALDCVTKILSTKDLDEEENQILNFMIKHYIEWSSTYMYLDQIAEELHYPSSELLNILRKLQSKRLVYLYTDTRFGIRVGLGKSFKQLLDMCIKNTR